MHLVLLDSDRDHARLAAAQIRLLDAEIVCSRAENLADAERQVARNGSAAVVTDLASLDAGGATWADFAARLPRVRRLLWVEPEERDAGSCPAPVECCVPFVGFAQLVSLLRGGSRSSETALPLPELTPREREILTCLASGKSNKVIAQELALSHRTVMNHVNNIYRKLEVNNRLEAVHRAISSGLVKIIQPF